MRRRSSHAPAEPGKRRRPGRDARCEPPISYGGACNLSCSPGRLMSAPLNNRSSAKMTCHSRSAEIRQPQPQVSLSPTLTAE